MIKTVMNKASEMKTMLGGVALVARAERVIENTTIRRVNEVIIMTIDGAKDKTVISAKTLKMRAVAVPVFMVKNTREKDLQLFTDLAQEKPESIEDASLKTTEVLASRRRCSTILMREPAPKHLLKRQFSPLC